MTIHGLQKMTLLDYPGRVACTIFTGGCNFRCPFCHNASLVTKITDDAVYTEEEVLSFLKKRTGLLDGVCITGGEPLLQRDIKEFISKVKALGFPVKLDTNGSFPEKLLELIDEGLVDRVAMDVKNSKEKYGLTAGACDILPAVEKSVSILLEGRVEYEFRTTVTAEHHTPEDAAAIGKWIAGAPEYYIQPFVDSGDLIGTEPMSAPDRETLEAMREAAAPFVKKVSLRGTD